MINQRAAYSFFQCLHSVDSTDWMKLILLICTKRTIFSHLFTRNLRRKKFFNNIDWGFESTTLHYFRTDSVLFSMCTTPIILIVSLCGYFPCNKSPSGIQPVNQSAGGRWAPSHLLSLPQFPTITARLFTRKGFCFLCNLNWRPSADFPFIRPLNMNKRSTFIVKLLLGTWRGLGGLLAVEWSDGVKKSLWDSS